MGNIIQNTNCVTYVRACDWNQLTDVEPVVIVQYESSLNHFQVAVICFVIALFILLICYGIVRVAKVIRSKASLRPMNSK